MQQTVVSPYLVVAVLALAADPPPQLRPRQTSVHGPPRHVRLVTSLRMGAGDCWGRWLHVYEYVGALCPGLSQVVGVAV